MIAGVTLRHGTDYGPWHGGLGENFVNVADVLGDSYEMWNAGKLPFIHLMFHPNRQANATIQNIASGMFDTELKAWLRELKAYCDTGRKAVVVYLPEMNGNWTVYATDDYSTDAFKTAFRRFVQMGRDMGLDETRVRWCWAPNDTGWLQLASWYPGDEYVDIVGSSAYNWGGIFDNEPWESPATLFDRYVSEVREFTNKPIIITQTGAGMNDPRTPAWLQDVFTYDGDVQGVIYFNIDMFEVGMAEFNAAAEKQSPPLEWWCEW